MKIKKQFIFIFTIFLLLFILGSLLGNTLWQISKLRRAAYQSEQEVVATLKEHIKKIPEDAIALDDVLDAAKAQINLEEKTWSAFSGASRSRFLEYLMELTSKINKAELGLDIEKLSISEDTIIMKGHVNGYKELQVLEHDLGQSKLFKVEPVNDPNFTMTIRIKKSGKQERP